MSTKIGIIAEGPIDHVLLPALLSRIAQDRAGFTWPLVSEDIAVVFQIRKKGHGGVLETMRRLVVALDSEYFDYAFFVVLLDYRTKPIQKMVRKLIRDRSRFVLGIAIEEIEAWWLADRTNTLAWSGFSAGLPPGCRYGSRKYKAEKDKAPKKTLNELTRLSNRIDRYYGDGNLDLATDFAEEYWQGNARLDEISVQCPRGFVPFQNVVTNEFRQAKSRSGRLW